MRKLTRIQSQRAYAHWSSFNIVYEWEDILAKELNIHIKSEGNFKFKFFRRFEKYGFAELYHFLVPRGDLKLRFVMQAKAEKRCILDKNTIPVIIDFWLEDQELAAFYEAYKYCPLVLVTSAEVVEFLKNHQCPLPIEHWPLSYPDIYKMDINKIKDKKYDFCIFGRPNPFFIRMLDEYCEKHPDFTYIHSIGTENNRAFVDHNGNVVMNDTGRQSYLDMISKTKISCYTTPGIDESKKITGRFNQVTPRLFEMLTNGCSVIGHYPDNADTRFYELSSLIPNVDNYNEFEQALNALRTKPLDFSQIASYMDTHYTSTRAKMLLVLLKKHSIEIQ